MTRKIRKRTRLAALLLAVSGSAGAHAVGKQVWIEVEGGAWTPDTRTMAGIKAGIEAFARVQAQANGRELKAWTDYTFQYQGRQSGDGKSVFINAFCTDGGNRDLDKDMVVVMDGGSCFFNLKYDPNTERFYDIIIHGDA